LPEKEVEQQIEALLHERRTFNAPEEFRAAANANDESIYEEASRDPVAWWAKEAKQRVTWFRDWDEDFRWDPPHYEWFVGGKLNASYNCLDRHLDSIGDRTAYIWVPELDGETRRIPYAELHEEVCKFANVLKDEGIGKGDTVAIYMGMVPELPVAMLACSRIGAPHVVVFGGFSADALRERINQVHCKALVTMDGSYRRGEVVPLKQNADEAMQDTPTIERCIVVKRTGSEVDMEDGRDVWYHEVMADASSECEPEEIDAEDPLYMLHSSGTTGKPKGITHTTGGYLTQVASTHYYVFDIKPETDIYWCAADIGWVTGHSYIVYGPLTNGCTSVLYEGAPNYPDKDRFWTIIEEHKVTILYTAPTTIRTFMKWGVDYPNKHDLSSLRLLGTVGEPINPEAWLWYQEFIGAGKTPVVDTWWQTETGAIMVTPLPGVTTLKPGSATLPFPGIVADVVDDQGESVGRGRAGYLVIKHPTPGMLRTLYGDDERYVETYWSRFGDKTYFPADGCKLDEDGYFWLLGRVDDVMNISGHRISTYEVESALVDDDRVAEAAVIGAKDEDTGQAIVAFVTLKGDLEGTEELIGELREHVAKVIGKLARPKSIIFTDELPKTRSGKIMRRLLKDVAEGRELGDVTTLQNAPVVEEIRQKAAVGAGEE
jgi:acetyl-CoA synthetase